MTKLIQAWLISLAFVGYGFLPYKYAFITDTSSPNHIITDFNECGCRCPEDIIEGYIDVPQDSIKKYKGINTAVFFLNQNSIHEIPFEIKKAYLEVELVKIDTLECGVEGFAYAPMVRVTKWGALNYDPIMWNLDKFLIFIFFTNFLFVAPLLTFIIIGIWIRNQLRD